MVKMGRMMNMPSAERLVTTIFPVQLLVTRTFQIRLVDKIVNIQLAEFAFDTDMLATSI